MKDSLKRGRKKNSEEAMFLAVLLVSFSFFTFPPKGTISIAMDTESLESPMTRSSRSLGFKKIKMKTH